MYRIFIAVRIARCCLGNTVVHAAVVTILVTFALSQKVSKLFCICLTFLDSVTLYNNLFDKLPEEEIQPQPCDVQHAPGSWQNCLLSCPWKPPNPIQSPACLFWKIWKCKNFWKKNPSDILHQGFYVQMLEPAAPPGFCMGPDSCRRSACTSPGVYRGSRSLGQIRQEQEEVADDSWMLHPCRAPFPWKLLWYQGRTNVPICCLCCKSAECFPLGLLLKVRALKLKVFDLFWYWERGLLNWRETTQDPLPGQALLACQLQTAAKSLEMAEMWRQ